MHVKSMKEAGASATQRNWPGALALAQGTRVLRSWRARQLGCWRSTWAWYEAGRAMFNVNLEVLESGGQPAAHFCCCNEQLSLPSAAL